MSLSRVWTATIEALDGANNPVTLRFADGAYIDSSALFYEPRMRQPALMRVMANTGIWIPSLARSSIGEIELVNADGGLNYLVDYALDGRDCVISLHENGASSEYFRGTVTGISEQGNMFRVSLRPGSQALDKPLPMQVYTGDNVLPNGVEGGDEIAGQSKPQVWGRVDNGTPVLVNTALLIYQASSRDCVISNVRDRGIELTRGADYTSIAAMELTAPAAGQFRCYQGYFRLGDAPSGSITFDAKSETAAGRKAGSLLSSILAAAGTSFCPACAANLDAASGECGIYLTDTTPTSEVMTFITQSVGGFWYYDAGLIRVGLLNPPAGGGQEIRDWSVIGAERRGIAAGLNGVPVSEVSIPFAESSTVQTDLAGGASTTLIAKVASRWRWKRKDSPATVTRHPLAEPIELDYGVEFNGASTDAVCTRMLNLLSVRRDMVSVDVQLDAIGPVTIGDEVTLFTRRLGYNSGRDFICVGYELNARKNRITLELFG